MEMRRRYFTKLNRWMGYLCYPVQKMPTLPKVNTYITRGNDLRLQKFHVKCDLRKFGFANRVVNTWNSLTNWVVSANTTNTFKSRRDKFWQN